MVKREFVETVSVLEESLPRVAFAWSNASLSRQFPWKNILRRVTRTSGIFVVQSEFVETVHRWKTYSEESLARVAFAWLTRVCRNGFG